MRKRDFTRLLKRYTAKVLASVMQVHPQTVRRWRRTGIPVVRQASLDALAKAKRHEGYEEKTLRELMALKPVKPTRKSNRPHDGARTTGHKVNIPIAGFFGTQIFLKVKDKLTSEPMRGEKRWMATATFSALSDAMQVGYKEVRIQVKHPEANSFVLSAVLSSGVQSTKAAVISDLISQMAKLYTDNRSRFYLHSVQLYTYRFKSEAAIKANAKGQRKKRKK